MTVTLDFDQQAADVYTRRTLSELSLAVAKSKRIVVVTGAGISCSCGIPDFRSSDGLYNLVKERYPDVVMKGRDLFDASLFRDPTSTAVFYTFISGLKRSIDAAIPAPTHHFIKTLDSKNKLLRSYTQNIDGLEERVGLLGSSSDAAKSSGKGKMKIRTKDVRNVQLHGDIHRVRCMACSAEFPCEEEHLVMFEKGTPPDCPECLTRSEARVARSARALRVGTLRPGIVLYDETHPLGEDIGAIHSSDLSKKPDMLIIMGTSLKVHGLRKLVKDFAKTVHASSSSAASTSKRPFKVIFVNKTAPSSEWSDIIDYHVAGETDAWTAKVVEEWKKMRPADWEIQQTLTGGGQISVGLKAEKPKTTSGKPRKAKGSENISPVVAELEPPSEEIKPKSKAAIPVAPLSPSKRRQKTTHYEDGESSPSKRHTTSTIQHGLNTEERKVLFSESTNKYGPSTDKLRVDMSICDLSMRDIFLDAEKETSKMDISICNISMKEIEAPAPKRRTRPTRKATVELQGSTKAVIAAKQQEPPLRKRKPTKRLVAATS